MTNEEQYRLNSCLNCGEILDNKEKYCPSCGQKNKVTRIRFREMVSEFFGSVFNLDSSIWRTLAHLFVPGKTARAYCMGKRKKYVHPVRIFLFSSIALLAVINFDTKEDLEQFDFTSKWSVEGDQDLTTMYLTDYRYEVNEVGKPYVDTILLDHLTRIGRLGPGFDVTYLDSMNLEQSGRQSDSVTIMALMPSDLWSGENLDKYKHKFHQADLILKSNEELLASIETRGFWDRLFVQQIFKFFKNPSGSVRYLLGSLLWTFLLIVPTMAFLYKLRYYRKRMYFVEHTVFMLYVHAALFLVLSFAILPVWGIAADDNPLPLIVIVLFFFWLIWSTRRFYKVRWINAIFTTIFASFLYFIAISLYLSICALLRFLLI